ncbi:carbohydrate sulfotransferase 9-like [Ylistrum balloti]|uniref:carbohydrate sulfotransferase 9-like n=1 Tax=Ylistrum balloti TaxID=509963 RepID=UPI002905F058|nr:carbohydrate sulfotransferase 9-like [Ylistrum balloti]
MTYLHFQNRKKNVKDAKGVPVAASGESLRKYEVHRQGLLKKEERPIVFTTKQMQDVTLSGDNYKQIIGERKEEKRTEVLETNDPEVLYKGRRDNILDVCSRQQFNQTSLQYVASRNVIDRKQKLAYCTIQKSASTFWKRVFRIVIGQSNALTPFDPTVRALEPFDRLANLPAYARESFMKTSLTFMFVREPYGRLFSGYVDKLFSPNFFFWKKFGVYGVKLLRKNPSKYDLKCGHDLSFREFVKTVIHAEKHGTLKDGHFTPQYEHCRPCHYKYDFIGKLETLKQDTFYLLNKMGKFDLRKSMTDNFHESTVDDTIRDQAKMLFSFRKHFSICGVSFFQAQKLMWKKCQIRGILSKNSKYPVTEEMSENIEVAQYIRMLNEGRGDALDKSISKRNKEEAMLEAFSTVDAEDMEFLSEMFRLDCELFGYDCRPEKLFKIKKKIKPWYFDSNTA